VPIMKACTCSGSVAPFFLELVVSITLLNIRLLGHPPCSLVTTATEVSRPL
jgi:hypothetical protein